MTGNTQIWLNSTNSAKKNSQISSRRLLTTTEIRLVMVKLANGHLTKYYLCCKYIFLYCVDLWKPKPNKNLLAKFLGFSPLIKKDICCTLTLPRMKWAEQLPINQATCGTCGMFFISDFLKNIFNHCFWLPNDICFLFAKVFKKKFYI